MECKDTWVCLCAYLVDGEPEPEMVRAIEDDHNLCPKCRSCSDHERQREIELQRNTRTLIQRRLPNITAPDFLKKNMMLKLGEAEEYRESGVQALGLVRWGTHIAQVYRNEDELAEVLVPYTERGLEDNELCAWMTSEISKEKAREALTKGIPNLQEYMNRGQMQFLSYQDWYMPDGRLNVQYALDSVLRKYQEALSNGYSGLRITGNIFWLDESGWDSLMQYEDLLDDAVQDINALVICVYKESECTTDNIVDVINRHRYVISKVDDSWRLRRP